MKHGKQWTGIAAVLGMTVLILDSKTAIMGASQGIRLCIGTVVPAIFPFLLLSNQIISAFSGGKILQPFARLFHLPPEAAPILIPGFLGGYPVGAQCIAKEYSAGRLQKAAAERLLMFCSNAGPSFLFGIIGTQFSEKRWVWGLWAIHILSAMMVSGLFPPKDEVTIKSSSSSAFDMGEAVTVMGMICGWVVVFRVVICFVQRWFLWALPNALQVAIMGILELSNGCCALGAVENEPLRFLLCAGMLSFGGICVLLQTGSVIGDLSSRPYIKGKLLQALFSVLLAAGFLWNIWVAIGILLVYFLRTYRNNAKNSSNPRLLGV